MSETSANEFIDLDCHHQPLQFLTHFIILSFDDEAEHHPVEFHRGIIW
jgi:hypothetical protein